MADTDGPIPRVGSEKYKEWVVKAINTGYLRRLEKVDEIPDFGKGVKILIQRKRQAFLIPIENSVPGVTCGVKGGIRGGDLGASGCASCHVLYGNDGKYEGDDPTIKNLETRPHPLRHRITTAIPAAQCTHCHTRGEG